MDNKTAQALERSEPAEEVCHPHISWSILHVVRTLVSPCKTWTLRTITIKGWIHGDLRQTSFNAIKQVSKAEERVKFCSAERYI